MLKIRITKKAKKFLSTLPAKQKRQLANKIGSLQLNPIPHDVKRLVGMSPYLRVDFGEYRIIYRTTSDTVIIALVGKRNDDDIYKQAKRTLT